MPRKLLVITILLFPFFSNSQTCIIARKTKNEIILGADSRITDANGKGKGIPSYSQICKIRAENGFYFACSGMLPLTANSVLKRCAREARTNEDMFNLYVRYMKDSVLITMDYLSKTDPKLFEQIMRWPNAVTVVLCHFQNDTPSLMAIGCKVRLADDGRYHFYSGRIYENTAANGETTHIDSLVDSEKTWKNKNPAKVIKMLIEKDTTYELTVGPPVDIIKITENGYKWLYNKKSCNIAQ